MWGREMAASTLEEIAGTEGRLCLLDAYRAAFHISHVPGSSTPGKALAVSFVIAGIKRYCGLKRGGFSSYTTIEGIWEALSMSA